MQTPLQRGLLQVLDTYSDAIALHTFEVFMALPGMPLASTAGEPPYLDPGGVQQMRADLGQLDKPFQAYFRGLIQAGVWYATHAAANTLAPTPYLPLLPGIAREVARIHRDTPPITMRAPGRTRSSTEWDLVGLQRAWFNLPSALTYQLRLYYTRPPEDPALLTANRTPVTPRDVLISLHLRAMLRALPALEVWGQSQGHLLGDPLTYDQALQAARKLKKIRGRETPPDPTPIWDLLTPTTYREIRDLQQWQQWTAGPRDQPPALSPEAAVLWDYLQESHPAFSFPATDWWSLRDFARAHCPKDSPLPIQWTRLLIQQALTDLATETPQNEVLTSIQQWLDGGCTKTSLAQLSPGRWDRSTLLLRAILFPFRGQHGIVFNTISTFEPVYLPDNYSTLNPRQQQRAQTEIHERLLVPLLRLVLSQEPT